MVVQHNITGNECQQNVKHHNRTAGKIQEKLSSGYRINRATDDAAGLTISEKMRKNRSVVLTRLPQNAQDGVSASSDSRRCFNRSTFYVTENERVSSSVCEWNKCTV